MFAVIYRIIVGLFPAGAGVIQPFQGYAAG